MTSEEKDLSLFHHRLDDDDPLLLQIPSDVLEFEIRVFHEEVYSEG